MGNTKKQDSKPQGASQKGQGPNKGGAKPQWKKTSKKDTSVSLATAVAVPAALAAFQPIHGFSMSFDKDGNHVATKFTIITDHGATKEYLLGSAEASALADKREREYLFNRYSSRINDVKAAIAALTAKAAKGGSGNKPTTTPAIPPRFTIIDGVHIPAIKDFEMKSRATGAGPSLDPLLASFFSACKGIKELNYSNKDFQSFLAQ